MFGGFRHFVLFLKIGSTILASRKRLIILRTRYLLYLALAAKKETVTLERQKRYQNRNNQSRRQTLAALMVEMVMTPNVMTVMTMILKTAP